MNQDILKEEVAISYTISWANIKETFVVCQVKVFVVNGARNRFVGSFDSIDKAVEYALNKDFKIFVIE